MVLTLAGALLALMGLASALMLLLGLPAGGGWLLWLLFPLFTLLGFGFVATGGRGDQGRTPLKWLSFALLGLAGIAALALFGHASGALPARGGLTAVWYVLVLAGAAGGLGTAALTRKPDHPGDAHPREGRQAARSD
jgi:hypothetical protein